MNEVVDRVLVVPHDDPDATEAMARALRRQAHRAARDRAWAAKRTQRRREARAAGQPVRYYRASDQDAAAATAALAAAGAQRKARLTKARLAVLLADARGYWVDAAGVLRNPAGRALSPRIGPRGAPVRSLAGLKPDGALPSERAPRWTYRVAQLAAYQRWGAALFVRGAVVGYRDGNAANLTRANLFLTTRAERRRTAWLVRQGERQPLRGRGLPLRAPGRPGRKGRYSWATVQFARAALDLGLLSQQELAKRLGMSRSLVSLLWHNQVYREQVPEGAAPEAAEGATHG